MNFLQLNLFLFVFLYIYMCEACMFKYNHREVENPRVKRLGRVILKNYTRKLSKSKCLCGKFKHDEAPNFIIYAHFNLTNETQRVCPLTVINSNMAITSHRCLMKGSKINVFDAWKPSERLVQPKEILLSTQPFIKTENGSANAASINVTKIIYKESYGFDFQFSKSFALDSDVAIVVSGVKFQSVFFNVTPICVPKYQEIPTRKIINRNGLYQGVRGWDDLKEKYAIKIYNRFATILPGKTCNEATGLKLDLNEDTLCLRYGATGPTIEGGPLSLTVKRFIDGGPDRAYLVGIATWVNRSISNAEQKFVYFTNINSVVKHIEYHAEKEGSEWCEMPSQVDDDWPWHGFIKKADQSLDCECGIKPKGDLGRIVGGENATLHEFPWLVQLLTAVKVGDGHSYLRCGGSVINDRVILTAAHCIIDDSDFKRKDFNTEFFNLQSLDERFPDHEFYLRAYTKRTQNTNAGEDAIRVYPKKFLFHPGYPEAYYISKRSDFDIGLLILNESIAHLFTEKTPSGNAKVVPLCLPKPGDLRKLVDSGMKASFAGWGGNVHSNLVVEYVQKYNGSVKDETVLQKLVEMPVYDVEKCSTQDADEGQASQGPTDTRLCAGHNIAFKDIFQGDSGGPLIVELEPGRFTQIGLANNIRAYTNFTNYQNRYPPSDVWKAKQTTIYANVEAFLDYINYYSDLYGAKGCRQRK